MTICVADYTRVKVSLKVLVMQKRNRVLAMVCALMTILMLDRVCLSVAGPRMQAALHIGPAAWDWVNAVFAIAFACFEIPMGELGDRIGPRKVLTRIVLWWSGFKALTGAMVRLPALLVVRFSFGLGPHQITCSHR